MNLLCYHYTGIYYLLEAYINATVSFYLLYNVGSCSHSFGIYFLLRAIIIATVFPLFEHNSGLCNHI